jgi:membrane protease subunit HflC
MYAAAYGQNPEFYRFYRRLEAYRATFKSQNNNVLVLDPSSEFLQFPKLPGGALAPQRQFAK